MTRILELGFQVMFSIIAGKTLHVLRASLLHSSSNGVSADTVDDEGFLSFLLKLSLHQYSQNILKLLAFKCFLNDVLLEAECSKVLLIC